MGQRACRGLHLAGIDRMGVPAQRAPGGGAETSVDMTKDAQVGFSAEFKGGQEIGPAGCKSAAVPPM